MLLSIIIPTHNSKSTIERCIKSLNSQSISREKFEIVVVDDGSVDETLMLAKKAGVDKIIQAQSCFQGKARNIGVTNSDTEYIAFLDSDCKAEDGWIKSIMDNLTKVRAVTGPISNGHPESLVAWGEYFVEFGGFYNLRKRSSIRFLAGCNQALTRESFSKTKGFTELRSCEDILFGESLRESRIDAFFIPEMRVAHLCRTDLKRVLSNMKLLGKYYVRATKQNPKIMWASLANRWFIPILFFGKIMKSMIYAIKGRKTRKFFLSFGYIFLNCFAFCEGIWEELGVKK